MLPAGEVLFRQRVHASAPVGVAPEPLGDLGRIIWGVFHVASGGSFVSSAGARERTRGCSPRAIRVESSEGFRVASGGSFVSSAGAV